MLQLVDLAIVGSLDIERNISDISNKPLSDMDYFKSRVKKDWSDSDADDVDEPSSSLEDEDYALQTGRLFVKNLLYTATEDDLREHFSKYGSLSEVHLVVDRDTKRSKGIAYVLYALPESAAMFVLSIKRSKGIAYGHIYNLKAVLYRALEDLDNSIFQGRLLHVMPAKQKIVLVKKNDFNHRSKTFKQRREEKRKKSEISGDTRAWNSLFMRPDTVVENIAREFGTSKSELLDRKASDVAIRIALTETQVVVKTKKALANAGVNNFASKKTKSGKRSSHVILVKNLPYSTESELACLEILEV